MLVCNFLLALLLKSFSSYTYLLGRDITIRVALSLGRCDSLVLQPKGLRKRLHIFFSFIKSLMSNLPVPSLFCIISNLICLIVLFDSLG